MGGDKEYVCSEEEEQGGGMDYGGDEQSWRRVLQSCPETCAGRSKKLQKGPRGFVQKLGLVEVMPQSLFEIRYFFLQFYYKAGD